jgi:CO/xanthine dehydrogenase Mo-binding subunit
MPALSDISMPGLVHVALVRAPTARGRLVAIGINQLPRGYRMITAKDIIGDNKLPGLGIPLPLLVEDRISWFGEPVALVAGPDPSLASELAAAVEIKWEEEEPDFESENYEERQVVARRKLLRGEPDKAFEGAPTVLSGDYRSSSLEHFYSEPQGALAYFDYDRLVVRTATQWPSHVRDSVASALGTKATEIRVLPTRLGIHLDGKLWYPSILACHAALAAKACKAPARILFTREEDFRFSPKGARTRFALKAALDKEGAISALDVSIVIDMGAHGPFAEEMLAEAGISTIGAYACPNLRLEAVAITTNTPPAGAFAGLGAAHAFFAIESLASRLAEAVNEDPIEWKARNILTRNGVDGFGGGARGETPIVEIGSRLSLASDFRRKHASYELVRKRRSSRSEGPLKGVGFAFGFQCDGIFLPKGLTDSYVLEATLGKDLRLSISANSGSPRGGIAEVWRAESARILSLPPESVDILPPDTDRIPLAGPNTHSRGISMTSRLVTRACSAIQKRRFREPLPISARVTGRVDQSLVWGEGTLEGKPLDQAAWAGAIVEVELEPWTLQARPIGLWLCVDGGAIVSRERATRALRSAAFDALGASSGEAVKTVEGRIDTESYFAYSLPLTREIPPIMIDFIEGGRGSQPRGIGNLPFHVVPAAFLSAVSQAAGYTLASLPAIVDQVTMELEPS